MEDRALVIKRIQTWVWVFVYAGIIAIGVGLTARRDDASTGTVIVFLGAALVAVGMLLIWIRSRMRAQPPATRKPPT